MSLKFSAAFLPFGVPNTRNLPANFVIPWNQPGSENQLTHCDAICVGIFFFPGETFCCWGNELGPLCGSLGHGRWDQCLGFAPCGLRRADGALSATSAGLCWGLEMHQVLENIGFFLLLFQGICWFLRVKLREVNINLFSRRLQVVNLFKDSHWLQGP